MPGLRVALDLTGLESEAMLLRPGLLPVRFVEALIHHVPDVDFAVLTRPATSQALRHLDAPNARREAIPYPRVIERLGARLARRSRRTRLAQKLGLNRLRPIPLPWSAGVLSRLHPDVIFRPFMRCGLADASVPLVAAVHDLQHLTHPYLLSSAERSARERAFIATCRQATRIVCSTPSLEGVLHGEGLAGVQVVSVAPGLLLAHPSANDPATKAGLARHRLSHNGYFVVAADFEPRHNHRVVLTAMGIFRARNPSSRLRLVCVIDHDTRAADLRTVAQGMGLGSVVLVLGQVAHEERMALLEACRALIVPSLYETVGVTVLEAMALGRPVLCSRIPGLTDLTAGAALTFDAHSPSELAAAFERAEREPTLLEQMAQLGREQLARLGSAKAVAEDYVAVFRSARTPCPASQ